MTANIFIEHHKLPHAIKLSFKKIFEVQKIYLSAISLFCNFKNMKQKVREDFKLIVKVWKKEKSSQICFND